MSRSLRVLVAEDNAAYRRGLRELLESADEFEVVGEAENGEEAVRMALVLTPDVVVMDLRMPDAGGVPRNQSGLEAIREITTRHPHVAVVVLSSNDDEGLRSRARLVGARHYLLKDSDKPRVLAAIRDSAGGSRRRA